MAKPKQNREPLSKEWVEGARQRLTDLAKSDPKAHAKETYTKTDFVSLVADEIKDLLDAGFSLEHIVSTINDGEDKITTALLKAYLKRLQTRGAAKKKKVAKDEPAPVATQARSSKATKPEQAPAQSKQEALAPKQNLAKSSKSKTPTKTGQADTSFAVNLSKEI